VGVVVVSHVVGSIISPIGEDAPIDRLSTPWLDGELGHSQWFQARR
jgi:hypothetical protein